MFFGSICVTRLINVLSFFFILSPFECFLISENFNLDQLKKIIKETKNNKLIVGYKFGLEFLNSKNGRYFVLNLKKKIDVKYFIVSHKTKYPFIGEKIDLPEAANRWIKKNLKLNIYDKYLHLVTLYFPNVLACY